MLLCHLVTPCRKQHSCEEDHRPGGDNTPHLCLCALTATGTQADKPSSGLGRRRRISRKLAGPTLWFLYSRDEAGSASSGERGHAALRRVHSSSAPRTHRASALHLWVGKRGTTMQQVLAKALTCLRSAAPSARGRVQSCLRKDTTLGCSLIFPKEHLQ